MTRLDRHSALSVLASASLVALTACTFKPVSGKGGEVAYEVFIDPPPLPSPALPPVEAQAGPVRSTVVSVKLPATEMLISAAALVGVSEDAVGVPKLLATSDPLSDERTLVLEADQASVGDILRSLSEQAGVSVSWTRDGLEGVSKVMSYAPVSGTPARLIDRVCADANLYCRYVDSMKTVVVTAKSAFVVALPTKAAERKRLLAALGKAGAETTKLDRRQVWLRLDRVTERRIVTAIRADQNDILGSRGIEPAAAVPVGAKLLRVSGDNVDGDMVGVNVPDVKSALSAGAAFGKS